jgi:hypothetical protein
LHTPPAADALPSSQFSQSSKASDPDGDDFPAAQFTHVDASVAADIAEYLPALQSVQTEAPGEFHLLPHSQQA